MIKNLNSYKKLIQFLTAVSCDRNGINEDLLDENDLISIDCEMMLDYD